MRVPWHEAEPRYLAEQTEHETPETLYHRRWALTVLEQAMGALEIDSAARGESESFTLLKPALTASTAESINTEEVAEKLNIPRPHVKVRVHRLRQALREAVLDVLAETIHASTRSEVEAEMKDLLSALG